MSSKCGRFSRLNLLYSEEDFLSSRWLNWNYLKSAKDVDDSAGNIQKVLETKLHQGNDRIGKKCLGAAVETSCPDTWAVVNPTKRVRKNTHKLCNRQRGFFHVYYLYAYESSIREGLFYYVNTAAYLRPPATTLHLCLYILRRDPPYCNV